MAINELDQTDREILKLLQKDASRKSIATIHERIRRLKEQGYVKRIVAILDKKR